MGNSKSVNALTELPKAIERLKELQPKRTARELRQWRWENEIVPHLEASGLPKRFWFKAKRWKEKQKIAYDETKSLLLGKGAIIALVGLRGMGKTCIAAQLILERAEDETLLPHHRRPPYRKLSELIATFKPIFSDFGSKDSESLVSRHQKLCKEHPLLIIDELHDCDDQRVKNRLLTDTLDQRYANLVDTIIISNQTPEEFISTTSDSVISRMKEAGRIISCTWDSWR